MSRGDDVRAAGSTGEVLLRSLVERYSHGLRSYLSRLERDAQDVEEVLADVFFLAHAHIDTLAALHEHQVRSWLFRSAKLLNANRSRGKIRRRRRLDALSREAGFEPPVDDEFDLVDAALDRPEERDRIGATMAGLRPEHREVLVLDALGHAGPEIAERLGISAVAARKLLMHARVAFREAWLAQHRADGEQAGSGDGTPPVGPTERSRP